MAGSAHEASGLGRHRAGHVVAEGAHGRSGSVEPVGIGLPLRARGGILEVVHAVVFCHPGALDIGTALQLVVLARAFPAVRFLVAVETVHHLRHVFQRLQVETAGMDGVGRRTAIIKVELIAVHQESRIPEGVYHADRLPASLLGTVGAVYHALAMGGTHIIYPSVVDHHRRGIVLDREHAVGNHHMVPRHEVGGHPVTRRLGGKEQILVLEAHHHGVGGLTDTLSAVDQHETVVEVQGVTEGLGLCGHHSLYVGRRAATAKDACQGQKSN